MSEKYNIFVECIQSEHKHCLEPTHPKGVMGMLQMPHREAAFQISSIAHQAICLTDLPPERRRSKMGMGTNLDMYTIFKRRKKNKNNYRQ